MREPARVYLIRHAPTAATRRHAFPTDEPLDHRGQAAAAALRGRLAADLAVTAPAQRCRQTAALAGYADAQLDACWAELDFGDWAGNTLSEVHDRDPAALAAWLADPRQPPPGGESLTALVERVRRALAPLCRPGRRTAVFTSAGAIKAALLTVLDAPPSAIWRVDVRPCAVTTLHGHPPYWTIHSVNAWPVEEQRLEPVDPQAAGAVQ